MHGNQWTTTIHKQTEVHSIIPLTEKQSPTMEYYSSYSIYLHNIYTIFGNINFSTEKFSLPNHKEKKAETIVKISVSDLSNIEQISKDK